MATRRRLNAPWRVGAPNPWLPLFAGRLRTPACEARTHFVSRNSIALLSRPARHVNDPLPTDPRARVSSSLDGESVDTPQKTHDSKP